jgi:hypothetical protein
MSSLVGALLAAPFDERRDLRWLRVLARTAALALFASGYRAGNAYAGLALGALTYAALLVRFTRSR